MINLQCKSFVITGSLWGNPSVVGCLPSQGASDSMFWWFIWYYHELTFDETFDVPVIRLTGTWKIWKKYQTSNFQVNFSDWWLKYLSSNCLHEIAFRLMSLELTENKSNIGSGALNDLVFILYCRVIGQWLPTHLRSVGNQSGISWGAICNRLAVGRRLVGDCILSICFWLQKVCNFLEIGQCSGCGVPLFW